MIELNVNGRTHAIDADPDTPLLYVLRDDLALSTAPSSAAGWASAAPAR